MATDWSKYPAGTVARLGKVTWTKGRNEWLRWSPDAVDLRSCRWPDKGAVVVSIPKAGAC